MNKAVIVVASLAVGLSACGKTIPECGDAKVQELVLKIVKSTIQKGAEESDEFAAFRKEAESADRMARIMNEASDTRVEFNVPVFAFIPSLKMDLKLNAISSTKKDKDSGFNYCAATLDGTLATDLQFSPTPKNEVAWKKLREVNPEGAHAIDIAFETDANATNKVGIFKASYNAEKGQLLMQKSTAISGDIAYTANPTDDGKEVVVKVLTQ